MPSEFELTQLEKISSVIYIIASVILISSADKAQQETNERQGNSLNSKSGNTVTSADLAAIASKVLLVANIIFLYIAEVRLNQVEQSAQFSKNSSSSTPNKYITFGWILSTIGSAFKVIGTEQRANQSNVAII